MILYINTKDQKVITVAFKKGGEVVDSLSEENEFGSQVLLSLISKILDRGKIKFDNLTGVEVATDPGSFTGLRVGVAVANSLGFALGIPVNGKKMETEIQY